MNYDPNLVLSGRMAKQKVKLNFGVWDYRTTVSTVVCGNCQGLCVIDGAVDNIYESLATDGWGNKAIVLTREDGEELVCPDGEYDSCEFLKNMLIAAEIVDIKPEETTK
jgi:hypothetical protein